MRVFLPLPRELPKQKVVNFNYRLDQQDGRFVLIRVSSDGTDSTAPSIEVCRNFESCGGIVVDGVCSAGCSLQSDPWSKIQEIEE